MRHIAFLSVCMMLSGCSLFRPRPLHASPEEAAQYRFPVTFPEQEQQVVPGNTAAAITLAMEDFLPLWMKPPRDASPREACLTQRQSYDVAAAPASVDVILVSFSVREDVCPGLEGPPIADIPIIYAVDTRRWLILSIQK
jgi:hypothetical protein